MISYNNLGNILFFYTGKKFQITTPQLNYLERFYIMATTQRNTSHKPDSKDNKNSKASSSTSSSEEKLMKGGKGKTRGLNKSNSTDSKKS